MALSLFGRRLTIGIEPRARAIENARAQPVKIVSFGVGPFAAGLGSVVDLRGTSHLKLLGARSAQELDALALHGDWEAIGRDMSRALGRMGPIADPKQPSLFDPDLIDTLDE